MLIGLKDLEIFLFMADLGVFIVEEEKALTFDSSRWSKSLFIICFRGLFKLLSEYFLPIFRFYFFCKNCFYSTTGYVDFLSSKFITFYLGGLFFSLRNFLI